MRDDKKRVLVLAKKVLKKDSYKKLRQVKDHPDFEAVARKYLTSKIEKEFHELEKKTNYLTLQDRDTFFVQNYLDTVRPKIRHFSITLDEKELIGIKSMLEKIKEELENV